MRFDVTKLAAQISGYTSSCRVASRHAGTLADLLTARAPKDLSPTQAKVLQLVKLRAVEVDQVRRDRLGATSPRIGQHRLELANAWSSLHGALIALANVPTDVGAEAGEATALLGRLFSNGLSFVNGDVMALWGDTKMLLQRIDDEGLQPRIDAVVSPSLLRSVRAARGRLASVLGLDGVESELPRGPSLAVVNSYFAFAVTTYARALSADIDLDDDASIQRFFSAMQPLDRLRVDTRPGGKGSPEVEPEEGDFEEEPSSPVAGDAPVEPTEPELPDDPEINPFVTA
ncbi:MAG: hypothetical protein H6723_20580 [Sandaracinus sp.]|nr:hypothetical protein [Sandaracinus sp.]